MEKTKIVIIVGIIAAIIILFFVLIWPPSIFVPGSAIPLPVTEELDATATGHTTVTLSWRDPTDPWYFVLIGDFGTDNEREQAVADLINSWNTTDQVVEFIITVGDNIYAISPSFPTHVGNYYGEWVDNQKFWPSPGNHDFFGGSNLTDYLAYFSYLPPTESTSGNGTYYNLLRHNVQFYAINTGQDDLSKGDTESTEVPVTDTQAQWLNTTMTSSTSAFDVPYFHHPPYSSGEFPVNGSSTMRWPFDQWGADVVLSGHVHVYETILNTTENNLYYITQGLGGREAGEHCLTPLDQRCKGVENSFSLVQNHADNMATLVTVNYNVMNFTTTFDTGALVDTVLINSTIQDITGYQIERRLCGGVAFTVIEADTGNNNTSYNDSGLEASTCYDYRVSAININGIGPASNINNAITDATNFK